MNNRVTHILATANTARHNEAHMEGDKPVFPRINYGQTFEEPTKTIRLVNIKGYSNYVFDLDLNKAGKRKRAYARGKNELLRKIKKAHEKREQEIADSMPNDKLLSHWVAFYSEVALGRISYRKWKEQILVSERVIRNSDIDVDVDQLTTEMLSAYFTTMANHYSNSTLSVVQELVTCALKAARYCGLTVEANCDEVTISDVKYSGKYFVSVDELEAIKNACKSAITNCYGESRNVLLFMIYTKMSLAEVLAIKKSDICLEKSCVTVNGKEYELPCECREWLRLNIYEDLAFDGAGNWIDSSKPLLAISSYRHPDYEYLFGTEQKDGTMIPLRSTTVSNCIKALSRRIGLPLGIMPSSLEKSFLVNDYLATPNKKQYLQDYSKKHNISIKTLTDILVKYSETLSAS